jgi:glycosyltransferase involved in cell wall biosynthesis
MMRRLGLLGFENLQLLGRGVDTELFTPSRRCTKLRKKWGAAPEDPVLLYVGRVAAEKNLELFVKSYKQLRKKHPRIRAVIVGDGPEKDALRKEMPDAHFAGTLQGEQLAAHYASADLFLFPSLSETFGNVVTEAMASGLVTLAFNYAAPKLYIKDGFNGFTAKLNKEKDFLRKAEQILEDQANWPSLRKTAHESVQHLAWDSILGSFEQTHRQLAGDREQAA